MNIIIESVDDVLPHIVPDTGIIHSTHSDYSVINYVFTVDNTFDTALARECRGLKFDKDGALIARPFHKFFNLGEKRLAQDEPWDDPHVVFDKLDGSMIHPTMVQGELVFMTRMGLSDQAQQAQNVASHEVLALCKNMIEAGFTPIFEFTSPDNRIVLAYDKPQLTLLAIRHMRSGGYMSHVEMAKIALKHDVPTVATIDGNIKDIEGFWTQTRALEAVEGYVIAFDDGHRLKIKADSYVLRHKALAGLAHEKNLLAWIVTGVIDDVIPLLSPQDVNFVRSYHNQVMSAVSKWEVEINGFVADNRHLPRKEFALKATDQIDPRLLSVVFQALDGFPPHKKLIEVLERACGSDAKVESVRSLFGMRWTPPRFG